MDKDKLFQHTILYHDNEERIYITRDAYVLHNIDMGYQKFIDFLDVDLQRVIINPTFIISIVTKEITK